MHRLRVPPEHEEVGSQKQSLHLLLSNYRLDGRIEDRQLVCWRIAKFPLKYRSEGIFGARVKRNSANLYTKYTEALKEMILLICECVAKHFKSPLSCPSLFFYTSVRLRPLTSDPTLHNSKHKLMAKQFNQTLLKPSTLFLATYRLELSSIFITNSGVVQIIRSPPKQDRLFD